MIKHLFFRNKSWKFIECSIPAFVAKPPNCILFQKCVLEEFCGSIFMFRYPEKGNAAVLSRHRSWTHFWLKVSDRFIIQN